MNCRFVYAWRSLLIGVLALAAWGCSGGQKSTADRATAAEPAIKPAAAAGDVRAVCTVAPECPPSGSRKEELTTVRSGHTWTVENGTGQARDFVVVLEISDNLGHMKRKEVPGQVKAHAKVEDSTSIALVTTYQETGGVEAQARTTVRMGEQSLATHAQTCGFEVR